MVRDWFERGISGATRGYGTDDVRNPLGDGGRVVSAQAAHPLVQPLHLLLLEGQHPLHLGQPPALPFQPRIHDSALEQAGGLLEDLQLEDVFGWLAPQLKLDRTTLEVPEDPLRAVQCVGLRVAVRGLECGSCAGRGRRPVLICILRVDLVADESVAVLDGGHTFVHDVNIKDHVMHLHLELHIRAQQLLRLVHIRVQIIVVPRPLKAILVTGHDLHVELTLHLRRQGDDRYLGADLHHVGQRAEVHHPVADEL
mmetsp:Transcript_16578/g.29583  ORF Transcript_16578/g.29583 Transcript_16578/m.29583 type:complete len:254 (+) Transcript_16578:2537-3298(+)